MILTFIDDSDDVGKIAMVKAKSMQYRDASKVSGIQSMSSTREMVVKALMYSVVEKISALRIMDHGRFYYDRLSPDKYSKYYAGVLQEVNLVIGNDEISIANFQKYTNDLKLLNGRFYGWGFVHFFNCGVGQNRLLLQQFALCLQVPVYATTGYYAPAEDKSDGPWVAAFPDGTFQQGVKRPSAWDAMLNSVLER